MIKDRKDMPREITIDLQGPEGNAFCLIGAARDYAKQLGRDGDTIVNDMMSGDYDHLIEVFEREFGSFVTIYR